MAWITPAAIENWLGPNCDTPTATALAETVTSAARSYLQRDLDTADLTNITEVYDSNGTDYILLDNWPITSISQVSIIGLGIIQPFVAGSPISIPISGQLGYQLDRFVKRKLRFVGTGKLWRTENAISVTYTAGYDMTLTPPTPGALPADITQALLLIASGFWNSSAADPNLTSEQTAGVFSGTFIPGGVGSIPLGAQSLLNPHRRVSP